MAGLDAQPCAARRRVAAVRATTWRTCRF